MVAVAQLVRAPDCGSGGRGFEPHPSPQKNKKKVTKDLLIKKFMLIFVSQLGLTPAN
jgi:hypothetical protein